MKKHQSKSHGRSLLTTILITLNAFVLGGCLVLLIINRLLKNQLDIYVSSQSMAAGSTILDFMDDLLPFYLLYASALLLLLLVLAAVWAWAKTQSRILRYGSILLILLALLLLAGIWFLGSSSGPIIPPTTPTPPAASSLTLLPYI